MFRRFLVGLCVVAHFFATIGLPVGVSSSMPSSVDETPFPCRNHGCGCRSAEQCWRSCCCMSQSQKLAWARRQGVKPPDWWRGPVAGEIASKDSPRPRRCCAARSPSSNRSPAESKSTVLLGFAAQKCQGAASLWISTGAVTPAPARVELVGENSPPRRHIPLLLRHWRSHVVAPDAPPPRAS